MNIIQESVDNFSVGYGGASALAKPIVSSGHARKAYKGVYVRAAAANTIVIYVGPSTVKTTTNAYPLPAGAEIYVPVEDPSKVYVVATPASDCQQTVTLAGMIAGETFTLTFMGQTTTPIVINANAAVVQGALRALSTIGLTGCSVADTGGGPPYTVTFTGPLAKTDVDLMTSTDGGISEVQNVTVTNAIANDKLVLTFGANSTSELAYNSTSAQIQTALEGLASIGSGNVSVEDGATGWDVEFVGDLEKTDVGAISGVVGKNEKQTVTISNGLAGDKLVLTYDGNSTAEVNYNVSGVDLQAALDGIVALNGKTSVTGNGPYVVEFVDTLAGTDVPAMTGVCGKNEKQTITVTGGAAGDKMILTVGAAGDTSELNYNISGADLETALEAIVAVGAGNVTVTGDGPYLVEFISALGMTDIATITGVAGKNEKQTITLDVGVSDGTFTLTFGAQTTDALAHDISIGDLETALTGLSSIGAGNVDVTAGDPSGWVVEFKGTLAKTDVDPIVGDGALLVGDVKTVTVVETVKGNLATVGVVENVKGNLATVGVVETLKGNTGTVTVTESQKGDAAFTITVAKVADITLGSKYSWLSV